MKNNIENIQYCGLHTEIDSDLEIEMIHAPAHERRGIHIGSHCRIYSRNRFVLGDMKKNSDARLIIGDHVMINAGCYLSGEGGLVIEDYVLIGPNTSILSAGHNFTDTHQTIQEQGFSYGRINIQKDAWIGASCVVLQGVTVGEGAVVGAGSVVTGDVPAGAVAVGNPARVIRYRDMDMDSSHCFPGKDDSPAVKESKIKTDKALSPLKYDYEINLENDNSSHSKILKLVGENKDILELGAASGYMTRYLKEQLSCRVVCLECDAVAAERAKPYCDEMLVGDVENYPFKEKFSDKKFDVIIMADLLEHLKDAGNLLKTVRGILKDSGYLLISIPNGAHGAVALSIMDGTWDYRDTGLLDTTHLKFYDRNHLLQLLDEKGYLVSRLDRVIVHPRDTEFKTEWEKYPREVTAYIEKVNPEFQTYQFIVQAYPASEIGWKVGLGSALEFQKNEAVKLETKLKEIKKELHRLYREEKRLTGELRKREGEYQIVLVQEKQRMELEKEQLQGDHQTELQRLEQDIKGLHESYEAEIRGLHSETKAVHAGYQKALDELAMDKKTAQDEYRKLQKQLFDVTSANTALFDEKSALMETNASLLRGKEGAERALNEVYASLAWRILIRYRAFLEKVLPVGSRKRRFYQLSLLAPVVLFKEGPRSFLGKLWARMSPLPGLQSDSGFENLTFPSFPSITVSIIIPVFNKAEYTYRCLASLIDKTGGDIPYEIIVVDNASTDTTPAMLDGVEGVIVIRNNDNKGFVEACNIGANTATGRYLLFLNNDTEVTPLWLSKLMAPFAQDDTVGAVGAKLIYPDGSLQEAGGIIWKDATGWNFGKGADPMLPEYSYLKPCDYCSGACLMVSRTVWEKAGGFDIRYAPAYYEDTDLCFTIRELGYKVVLQPESVVIHYEGVSAGTNVTTGYKRYQEKNKHKFFEKWKEVLDRSHYAGPDELFLARDHCQGHRILVADHYAPTFDKDSGSLRMFCLMKILAESGHKVVFWPENRAHSQKYTQALQREGVEVLYGDIRFDEYMKNNGCFFDIILLSRPHVAINMIYPAKTFSNARVIYDTVDLHFLREMRRSEFENKPVEHDWKAIELFLASQADHVLVVSDVEKRILEDEGFDEKVSVISNVHEIQQCNTPFQKRDGLLFIGGFLHKPNEDGMIWFVKKILPIIEKEIPHIKLTIVGSYPGENVLNLAKGNIEVTGFVEDVTPFFEKNRVFVSPLRYGAGVKGKIGQSLSYGLPVVTTHIGAEGMGCIDGTHLLIEDSEEGFARRLVQLYRDPDLWGELSQNGMALIKNNYSPRTMKDRLSKLIDSTIDSRLTAIKVNSQS